MSARQACPQCGDEHVVLYQVEGYEATCLLCLHGLATYHVENVHDEGCGAECAEQLLAFEVLRQRLGPPTTYMLVRLQPDGGHDEVVFRGGGEELGRLLRAMDLTPAVLSGRVTPLGRGRDGSEYEAVRL